MSDEAVRKPNVLVCTRCGYQIPDPGNWWDYSGKLIEHMETAHTPHAVDTQAQSLREVQRRAIDVILDNLDPPSPRLGRNDWCMNVEKVVRALAERGLLAHELDKH
jgi:NMD protein affecting ribosome stability and mRNA decay